MIRARITAGLAGYVALAVIGGSTLALAEETSGGMPSAEQTAIKKLMGDNFAGLQRILISLITSNYAMVPEQANVIHEHAVELDRGTAHSARSGSRNSHFGCRPPQGSPSRPLRRDGHDVRDVPQPLSANGG